MKLKHSSLFVFNVAIVGLVLLADRASKWFFLFEDAGTREGRLSFVSFKFKVSLNNNFAFSIPSPGILILAVVVLVLLGVLWFWVRQIRDHDLHSLWLALVVGGAMGNIADRIIYGGVVDWFELTLFNATWSSFNAADTAIVIGVIGWIISAWVQKPSSDIS